MLLLAVTNKICQDMAVIPFLWVLPLVVYLLSFIISFDSPRWYWRPFWAPAFGVAVAAILWVLLSDKVPKPDPETHWLAWLRWIIVQGDLLPMPYEIGVYIAALFICCMVCHGEVYRLRPAPRRLSGYYLLISAGGAFGGFVVAVVAPLAFHDYLELHVGLVLAVILVTVVLMSDPKSALYRGRPRWAFALVLIGVIGTAYGAYSDKAIRAGNAVEMSRSFFGVLKVYQEDERSPENHKLLLQHGGTDHGSQFFLPEKRTHPTAYYVHGSGVGRALRAVDQPGGRRVGVVGLGTGTLAAYGKPGDYFRFYEIDHNVQRLAHTRFSYLEQSKAKIEIAFGDARLSMEREKDAPFDLLALDAFSGDAIPVHLLTREAFEIYLRRLKPDGIIAVHISNRYLDLQPVVLAAAEHFHLARVLVSLSPDTATADDEESGYYNSDWILLSRKAEVLAKPEIAEGASDLELEAKGAKMWTDDWSNLLPILKLE